MSKHEHFIAINNYKSYDETIANTLYFYQKLHKDSRVETYARDAGHTRKFLMDTVRHPAVAGIFYPADQTELHAMIRAYLHDAKHGNEVPKAIIVPHADYRYSGPIAATAYARLTAVRDIISRVILFGPAHWVPFSGISASSANLFETPLGSIMIDQDSIKKALSFPQVHLFDEAHRPEHSLEVQLPFLQIILETFKLVPFVVGDATSEEVADVIEQIWGGRETLIVISSDLSHYYDYETAKRLDTATSLAIEALKPGDIHLEHACGSIPVKGMLTVARAHGMSVRTVDLRNSGDTAGSQEKVVGYGAYVFEEHV